MSTKKASLAQSEVVEQIPLACADERAALEFFERQRWGDHPCCPHCGDTDVYTIMDRKSGQRREDGRWRCRGCSKQFTVRVGQIMEDSPIPLRKWAYAFWCAASAKNGVSALEMSRKVQVSYKSALFMMNRIRWAMRPTNPEPRLRGTVEADETYVGGKPRVRGWRNGHKPRAKYSTKTPVFAVVQRGGNVRAEVMANVTAENLRIALADNVSLKARLMTDDAKIYRKVGKAYRSHETVCHTVDEYVRGDVHTNTVESFFARVKRGIDGVYHAVSKEHLARYVDQYEFLYNARFMTDGERITHLIRCADGKRLFYRGPAQKAG